jgi:hypothetical protein
MSTGTIPACELGLTTATLSAWHDQMVSAAEAERVRAHLAQCAACQGRLAEYGAIAQALRAQHVPTPDARLWLVVRSGMSERRAGSARFVFLIPARQTWKSLAAMAAVLLLIAGFAQALRTLPRGHVVTTSTPTPGAAPLSWQQAPQPSDLVSDKNQDIEANAPSDGNTAYRCVVMPDASESHLAVWVTHDRALHWTRTASPPAWQSTAPNAQCSIAVDALDARTVALGLFPMVPRQAPDLASVFTYVTTDGGGSWRQLTSPTPASIVGPFTVGNNPLATWHGVTYAIRYTQHAPSAIVGTLSASHDGMRTWQPIDQPLAAAGLEVASFWVNASSGEILAQATSQTGAPLPAPLWDTRDGGQHWTHLAEMSLITSGQPTVQAAPADQPWHICYLYQDAADHPTEANQLLCSADGGQTWLPRPTLNFTFTCYKCVAGGTPTTEVFSMFLLAIASDGAVLATAEVPQGPVTVPSTGNSKQPILTLYRLPAGGTVWQSLGALPPGIDNRVQYIAQPGGGVLWATGDAVIYTAAYP